MKAKSNANPSPKHARRHLSWLNFKGPSGAILSRRDFLAATGAVAGMRLATSLFSPFGRLFAASLPKRLAIQRPLAIIEAPFNLGLRPPQPGKQPGTRRLAEVLSRNGLPQALGAVATSRVTPPPYEYETTPGDGVRNAKAIYSYSLELSKAVGGALDAGQFPVVLGGDCSILLGDLLALRRRGRYGLVYLDAHSDTDFPAADHLTNGAGSDVTVATGHGTSMLTDIAGMKPLVRAEDTVVFGYLEYLEIKGAPITAIPLQQVRKNGINKEVERVVNMFRSQHLNGFWIHLDADVLNDQMMPAVDSRHEDGMSWQELRETLRGFLSSGLASGMEVTIYDPDLDPTGSIGRKFTATIVSSFE
jgi:arginase